MCTEYQRWGTLSKTSSFDFKMTSVLLTTSIERIEQIIKLILDHRSGVKRIYHPSHYWFYTSSTSLIKFSKRRDSQVSQEMLIDVKFGNLHLVPWSISSSVYVVPCAPQNYVSLVSSAMVIHRLHGYSTSWNVHSSYKLAHKNLSAHLTAIQKLTFSSSCSRTWTSILVGSWQ